MPSREKILRQQVVTALQEDVGVGDITSLATVDERTNGVAEIIAGSEGIVCGLPLSEYTFLQVDPAIEFKMLVEEGARFAPGDRVALIMGSLRSILIAERTALNFLTHLSGIASLTDKMVRAADNDQVKILDTRKTIPGLRFIEKYAVATGGGENHRYGLYDMVLIKDNHIEAVGSVTKAVENVRCYLDSEKFVKIFHQDGAGIEIEVEVENIDQLREALDCSVKRIMLDNTSPELLSEMIELARSHENSEGVKLEASGNVSLENIGRIAGSGVDFISIGALTHSAPASDFSLKFLDDE